MYFCKACLALVCDKCGNYDGASALGSRTYLCDECAGVGID